MVQKTQRPRTRRGFGNNAKENQLGSRFAALQPQSVEEHAENVGVEAPVRSRALSIHPAPPRMKPKPNLSGNKILIQFSR